MQEESVYALIPQPQEVPQRPAMHTSKVRASGWH